MRPKISPERKTAFYLGTALMAIGLLLFLSTFFSFASDFGGGFGRDSEAQSRSMMFRAFGGMALMGVGAFIRGVGARGLAGSGVVLDPEQAEKDLEPFSRMAGGMVKDALEEADIDLGGGSEKVVMIKCQACATLNEDGSRFCQECGKEL